MKTIWILHSFFLNLTLWTVIHACANNGQPCPLFGATWPPRENVGFRMANPHWFTTSSKKPLRDNVDKEVKKE
jgi:hypothetical protein